MARIKKGGGARRARASSPSAKAQKQIIPSTEELLGRLGNRPVSAEAAEFYNPRSYRNLAGEAIGLMGEEGEAGYIYYDNAGKRIDTSAYRQSFDIDDETGEIIVPGEVADVEEEEGSGPASISVIPTSSTDTRRPRTLAAGYDGDREVLTVVFRDGTWYNYYKVSKSEWTAFKAAVSKGKYIYSILDYKPRGDADTSGLSEGTRKALHSVAHTYQLSAARKNRSKKNPYSTGKIN